MVIWGVWESRASERLERPELQTIPTRGGEMMHWWGEDCFWSWERMWAAAKHGRGRGLDRGEGVLVMA